MPYSDQHPILCSSEAGDSDGQAHGSVEQKSELGSPTPALPSAGGEGRTGRSLGLPGHQPITRFRKTLSRGDKVEQDRAGHRTFFFSGTCYTSFRWRKRQRGQGTISLGKERLSGIGGKDEKDF